MRSTPGCLLTAILTALLAAGCSKRDTDGLSLVGRRVADRVEHAAGGSTGLMATSWRGLRACWGDTQLDCRVLLRLQWDQQLAGTPLSVELVEPGVVQLAGPLADTGLRRRAVDLAGSTAGVEKVLEKWGTP